LITECNGLKNNFHEIFLYMIDIRQRFEAWTNFELKVAKNKIIRYFCFQD